MTSQALSLLRPTSIVVDAPPRSLADETGGASFNPRSPRTHRMPSLPKPTLDPSTLKSLVSALPSRSSLGGARARSRGGSTLVGLDIQPGYVTAVQARVNGSIFVQRAAGAPLGPDTVREGELLDGAALADTLREMFRDSRLDRHVRVGVANQRTVLRTLELPPLSDRKELDTAVRFQAEDQVPMPLDNAVLDYHALGVIDTPAGPRQRVIVVAAQRDMVERLLAAVREAGLRPAGVDLSAFALIRSLYRADEQHAGRVLYLNVGGLTNVAIAEGPVCRFTRVVSGGLESMASEIAVRHGVSLVDARELLAAVDLTEPASRAPAEGPRADAAEHSLDPYAGAFAELVPESQDDEPSAERERPPSEIDARPVLAAGVREIAGEVRNSLEFHRSQGDGGEVSSVVLSGPALRISGFVGTLESELGVPVLAQTVSLQSADSAGSTSPENLAVAAGLATEEAPR